MLSSRGWRNVESSAVALIVGPCLVGAAVVGSGHRPRVFGLHQIVFSHHVFPKSHLDPVSTRFVGDLVLSLSPPPALEPPQPQATCRESRDTDRLRRRRPARDEDMSSIDEDASPGKTNAATPVVIDAPADGSSPFDPECQRGPNGPGPIVDDHDGDLVTTAETQDLKRGLGERHLTMLGIAGAIGTGLFLSLGGAIQTGGPLGALLGYAMVGGIVCAVQFALGEVTALLPVSNK